MKSCPLPLLSLRHGRTVALVCWSVACWSLLTSARAQSDTAPAVKVETVLEGLNHPCGIAIQPETGVVFISESGAGRIVKIVDGKPQEVIGSFPLDTYGKGPQYPIGPLGLVFLSKDRLVVGGGGLPDGQELVRVYDLSGGESLQAEQMVASFSLPPEDEAPGEGNFYGLAATAQGIYITANGDDSKGWIAFAPLQEGELTGLQRGIATKEATGVDVPVAITLSPRGSLVVGQMGEIDQPGDARLTFYNAKSGRLIANFATGLSDITGLAYSPSDGQLYAVDFAWHDAAAGGLFQIQAALVENQQVARAEKLLPLIRPTAIAIDDQGTMWVTLFGEENGQLLKITK